MANLKVIFYILLSITPRMEQRHLPPRFLREPENPFHLDIEPPIIMNLKRLLDDKSSEESSEITTDDDSEDTLEEMYNYYGGRNYYESSRFGRMELDSNKGEENFSGSSGPVITLPEREKEEGQENREVQEKPQENQGQGGVNPEMSTTTPETSSNMVAESSSTELVTESTMDTSQSFSTEMSSENIESSISTEESTSETSTELEPSLSTGRLNSRRLELPSMNYMDIFKEKHAFLKLKNNSESHRIENFHLFDIQLKSDY